MIELRDKQILIDGRTTVLLAPGTAVRTDASYDVDAGPDGTVRVTGGPGPISVRFGEPG